LKQEIFKRIKDVVLPSESIEISKDDLVKIITKKFPDFRNTLVEIQNFISTGQVSNECSSVSQKNKQDLYDLLYDVDVSYEKVYNFLMNTFTNERIDVMMKLLGKPFIDWSIQNDKNIDKLFECNYVISDYFSKLETNTDPIILGMTVIGKFRDILR
jgi:hypothetical protein